MVTEYVLAEATLCIPVGKTIRLKYLILGVPRPIGGIPLLRGPVATFGLVSGFRVEVLGVVLSDNPTPVKADRLTPVELVRTRVRPVLVVEPAGVVGNQHSLFGLGLG